MSQDATLPPSFFMHGPVFSWRLTFSWWAMNQNSLIEQLIERGRVETLEFREVEVEIPEMVTISCPQNRCRLTLLQNPLPSRSRHYSSSHSGWTRQLLALPAAYTRPRPSSQTDPDKQPT